LPLNATYNFETASSQTNDNWWGCQRHSFRRLSQKELHY